MSLLYSGEFLLEPGVSTMRQRWIDRSIVVKPSPPEAWLR